MEIFAQHRFARMAPRKLRQYRGLLVGLPVVQAAAQLKFISGQGPEILGKVLHSAVANARNNFDIEENNLKVADVVIDGGFSMKRYKPASKGSAHPILRRTSHVTVIVEEAVPSTEKPKKRPKTEIEEFTAADVAAGKVGGAHVHGEDDTDAPGTAVTDVAAAKKMQKPVSDATKTHRRKSMGE